MIFQEYVPEFRKVWEEITYHRNNKGIELNGFERDPDEGIEIENVKKVEIKFNAFADDSD